MVKQTTAKSELHEVWFVTEYLDLSLCPTLVIHVHLRFSLWIVLVSFCFVFFFVNAIFHLNVVHPWLGWAKTWGFVVAACCEDETKGFKLIMIRPSDLLFRILTWHLSLINTRGYNDRFCSVAIIFLQPC